MTNMVQIYHASLPFTEQRGLVVITETVFLKENKHLVNKQSLLRPMAMLNPFLANDGIFASSEKVQNLRFKTQVKKKQKRAIQAFHMHM